MGRRKRWPDEPTISAFEQGVLNSAAWLIAAHDRPTIALEMMETAGINKEWLIKRRKKLETWEALQFKKAGFFKK